MSSRSTRPRSPARERRRTARPLPAMARTRGRQPAGGLRTGRTPAEFACTRVPTLPARRSPRSGASARRTPGPRRCSCTSCSRTRRWWCAPRGCRLRPSGSWWRKSRACSGRAVYSSSMRDDLEFERPLLELENRIAELRASDDAQAARDEIGRLDERLKRLQQKVYRSLTPWQRAQLARHPKRPHTLDLFRLLLEDFVELHGDRVFGDDKAIVGGLARFEGDPVVAIGHQKGRDTRENIARNFGMPHPEGYRKALRLMELAAKFRKPIITFIDTPGAYPGLGAEERGQAEAIARNLKEMAGLGTPVVCVVTGEGGSGGALAIGVANRVLMLEHAIYSVISPEGCAAILWGEATKAPEAAELMRITAPDLLRLGVIDGIVPEPIGGAHRNWETTAENLRGPLRDALWELRSRTPEELVTLRYEKFRKIGVFEESA